MSSPRTVALLRLVASTALLVCVLTLFYQPLDAAFGPTVRPAVANSGLESVLAPSAKGFNLQLTTQPSQATLRIDGKERGQTPALVNVRCRDGQEVQLILRKEAFLELTHTLICDEGEHITLELTLQEDHG